MIELRVLLRTLIPRWLQNGVVFKLLYAIVAQFDMLVEMATAALRKRYPEANSEDVGKLLGSDRQIIRGKDEPWSTYSIRLRSWLDAHRNHGGPYGLLEQLRAYWAVTPFVIELYYAGTVPRRYFKLWETGLITRGLALWEPENAATHFSRWALRYHWPEELPAPLDWGQSGLKWGDGHVWGSGLSAETVAHLRRVPSQWGNAHSRGIIILQDPSSDTAEISLPNA